MTDPAYAPMPDLACMIPDCQEAATHQLIIVSNPEEHQLPLCAAHHLEYSQPGHLKALKVLAGLDRTQPPAPEPEPVEPGPEVIQPKRK